MSGAGEGGAGAAVRAGHLRKLKTMKKKYFVLRADTPDCSARLEYYESEKKYKSGAAPRRVVPLKSCYNITRRLDLKQKHVIALFTKEEQFCVVAENEQDLHGWLAAILLHRGEETSKELLYPIQHVWQVNVQKKGLGATKNIQGLYNLCLTDKTLTLVKIKSQNNVISDLGIPEKVEYSLKNIRRCGDSECFFYMEVGRQTATGAGELWMHSDDSNIAQSMHSTIYHAMRNCAKETENERDHIVIPKRSDSEGSTLPARRQSYSDPKGRAGLANESGLCVGSCIKQCVCAGDGAHSIDDSAAAIAPLAPKNAENLPPNNSLTEHKEHPPRVIKHHRTISLPTGCPLFQEPLKIVHERTRSAPLTGDEVDRAILEKAATHSSCRAVNGTDVFVKKTQWSRRASTGTRLAKLSPAHLKNAEKIRSRCDSMPSRPTNTFEVERPPQRHTELEGGDASRDEADSVEWHRTPRIPEEPDLCDSAIKEIMSSSFRSSIVHSRTSSIGVDEAEACPVPDGYVPMAPHGSHSPAPPLPSASSGSVCSGTPSTDARFSEYQLEPATSHIVDCERPPRAYSVGSRPAPRADPPRHRAYSVGASRRPPPRHHAPHTVCSAPQLPRASAEDLMELDFSNNSPSKVVVSQTPPAIGFTMPATPRPVDEYVAMSPRNAGYVEMRPGEPRPPPPAPTPTSKAPGYVEMNYSRAATRPIAIAAPRAPCAPPSPPPPCARTPLGSQTIFPLSLDSPAEPERSSDAVTSPEERYKRNGSRKPLVSQTIFPLSLESPVLPPELDTTDIFEDDHDILETHHPLTTVCEISEDGRKSPEVSCSPSYVKLAYSKPIAAPNKTPEAADELSCNPLATKTLAREPEKADPSLCATVVLAGTGGALARFAVPPAGSLPPSPPGGPPLNYASLDLEPRGPPAPPPPRTYTQIDFARSEKLQADHN